MVSCASSLHPGPERLASGTKGNHVKLGYKAVAAAAAAGLLLMAGSGAAANAAATVNGPFYNSGEAGYQVQSAVSFNEVRTTIHIPVGSSTSSFIALQQTVNGGKTYAIGLFNDGGN